MLTDDVLVLLSLYATADRFDAEAIQAHVEDDDSVGFVIALMRGLQNEWMTTDRYVAATSAEIPHDFPKALGQLLSKLAQANYFAGDIVSGNIQKLDTFRAWAYTPEWSLMSQDEDLLLMQPDDFPRMLQVANEPDCPKSDYLINCVRHGLSHMRKNKDSITQLQKHLAIAREHDANTIADYIEQLLREIEG